MKENPSNYSPDQREESIIFLEEISGETLPIELQELPTETLVAVKNFVQTFHQKKMNSLRRAMQANELTLKLIPNFLIHTIIKNYIDPSVAAIAGECLDYSLLSGIVSGLKPEYISESAINMDPKRAAELLLLLPKNLMPKTIQCIFNKNQLKFLDIIYHIPLEKIKIIQNHINLDNLNENNSLSKHRKSALDKIKTKLI